VLPIDATPALRAESKLTPLTVTRISPVVGVLLTATNVTTGESYVNRDSPVPAKESTVACASRPTPDELGTPQRNSVAEIHTVFTHAFDPMLPTGERFTPPKLVPCNLISTPAEAGAFTTATAVTTGVSYVNASETSPINLDTVMPIELDAPDPNVTLHVAAVSLTH